MELICKKVMKSNVCFSQESQITVLDDSLINYGFEPGDTVPLQTGEPGPNGVPVWELDGKTQARQSGMKEPDGRRRTLRFFLRVRFVTRCRLRRWEG